MRLSGKTALITGAGKRVGRVIAQTLHDAGANVVIHYRKSADVAKAFAELLNERRQGSAIALSADLCDMAALPGLVEGTVNRFGALDILVNNASTFFATPLEAITLANWDDLVGSNFKAPLFLTQAAAPHLRRAHGAIVNIVDVHAERPLAGYPLYCAAKAGLLGLTRALSIELAPEVRVNGVSPGPILWPEAEDTHAFDVAGREKIIEDTLLKRSGTPQDIGRAVLFLATEASYVTGQVLNVDGGRTAHL